MHCAMFSLKQEKIHVTNRICRPVKKGGSNLSSIVTNGKWQVGEGRAGLRKAQAKKSFQR